MNAIEPRISQLGGPSGPVDAPAARPLRIFDREYAAVKRHRDGTHRTRSPRETLELYVPRMPEFQITRLADVTGLDVIGVPVYMAVRPNSRGLAVSQGKGVDRHAAKASALMEAIESWHAERIEGNLRYESYAALRRSADVVDITRLPVQRNAVVEPNSPRLWLEGFDLLERVPMWAPFECVMTNFVKPLRVATAFRAGSSGLASGNHLLEATVHALCEVIERDAGALWQARGGPALAERRLDLGAIEDPASREVLDRLTAAGVNAAVWDITSDTGIPAYACRIYDRYDGARWTLHGICAGHGCHLAPDVALLRALTEAVQSRLTRIAGSRDDMFEYDSMGNPDDLRVFAESVEDSTGALPPSAQSDLSTPTFEGDVELLLAALRRAGIENAVLFDLTRPAVGIPVVKVVVPGLEEHPEAPGYAPRVRAKQAAAGVGGEA